MKSVLSIIFLSFSFISSLECQFFYSKSELIKGTIDTFYIKQYFNSQIIERLYVLNENIWKRHDSLGRIIEQGHFIKYNNDTSTKSNTAFLYNKTGIWLEYYDTYFIYKEKNIWQKLTPWKSIDPCKPLNYAIDPIYCNYKYPQPYFKKEIIKATEDSFVFKVYFNEQYFHLDDYFYKTYSYLYDKDQNQWVYRDEKGIICEKGQLKKKKLSKRKRRPSIQYSYNKIGIWQENYDEKFRYRKVLRIKFGVPPCPVLIKKIKLL